MFGRKRLLSALLAGVVTVSSFGASTAAFAAEDENKIEMTFDGRHEMDDDVWFDSLEIEELPDTDAMKKVENIIRKAAGVRADDEITYGDLAKVRTLNLSGLNLIDVPSCINYMVNLTRLDLSSNLLESEALKKLSLLGCTKLSNIDLSDNYLTTMPSWFVSDRVTLGNITQNFVDSSNPRRIEATISTYYLMDGETLDEDNLKNQILRSIRMNNGKLLPEIFFRYNSLYPPYPNPSGIDYPLDIIGWEQITDENEKVVAPQNKTITVTVKLFKDIENDNTKTTVTIYLLSGKDLYSLKKRLEGLKTECDALKQEDYTESSWNNLTLASDTAEAILKYPDADVQMLANALNALTKARDDLRYGTNSLKEMLSGLITVGGTYKKDNYTPASWAKFSDALEKLKKIAADKNAELETAQSAVKAFQRAQAGLRSAELKLPDIILKSEFEKIYGEAISVTASGVTHAGTPYKWSFYGKDLKETADFNPEVKDTDANESAILIEAGSISGYSMFATSSDKALPGKGTLEIDVSDKFKSGSFYLYKWNSSAKRSLMTGTATVTDGIAKIDLTEGGVYYICRNIQNFELKSRKHQVDTEKKTVIIKPTPTGVSASEFKNSFDFGSYTTVLDADGKPVSSNTNMKSGMTINAPNMDKYKVIIHGDVDANGELDIDDVSMMVDALFGGVGDGDILYYDLDGDGSITIDDVSILVDYFFMMF